MLKRILTAAGALALVVLCWISCRRQEANESILFTLNGAEKDIVVGLGPDANTLQFTLACNRGWELMPFTGEVDWIQVHRERTGTTTWQFTLQIGELTGVLPRAASLVFRSGDQSLKYTVQQEPPAAFFWKRQIGAYGVKGGDFLYDSRQQQLSLLHYPGGTSLRILDPASARVCTLSGLPEHLEAGQEITLHYRVCEKGLVKVSEYYTGVHVLRVTSSLAWLRQSDNVYFIITP